MEREIPLFDPDLGSEETAALAAVISAKWPACPIMPPLLPRAVERAAIMTGLRDRSIQALPVPVLRR